MAAVRFDIGEELIEQIARRAAELLVDTARGGEPEGDGYLDVNGAAAFLSCPKSRIYSLASLGRIPHYHDGSRLLFDRTELRDYVRKGGARRP
ncbi:MAG TPA: helix-turn-helix domain-containing protein [Solirubrobacterales bacterium]